MDKADEAAAKWLTLKGEGQSDPQPIRCLDCGGWPIDNGAVFIVVVLTRDAERRRGHMCELCYVKRMSRIGRYSNMSNPGERGRMWQIEVPELGIFKDRDAKERSELEATGARYVDALCALSVALGLPQATPQMREKGERFAKEYAESHPRAPGIHRHAELAWEPYSVISFGPKRFRHCEGTQDGKHEWLAFKRDAAEFKCSKCHATK